MLVRPIREEDAPSLQRNCFTGTNLEQLRAMIAGARDEQGGDESVWLVAIGDDGEVSGSCTVTRLKHRMCRHRADIGGLVVAPPARGTGLARRIVETAALHVRDWGCSMLELSCRGDTHAEDAYLRLGFIEWGRLRGGYHDHGGQIFDEVRLWMPICRD